MRRLCASQKEVCHFRIISIDNLKGGITFGLVTKKTSGVPTTAEKIPFEPDLDNASEGRKTSV